MLLKGQRFVVTGIASKLSIAWAIAQSLSEQGAALVLTYPNERMKKRVDQAAELFGAEAVLPLDVTQDSDFDALEASLAALWPEGFHGAVHAIGYAPADQLTGEFTQVTSREGFSVAHDISAYSFVALARSCAAGLTKQNGSLLTLTYDGASHVYPNYNVMGLAKASLEAATRYLAVDLGTKGVRVNAVSAGPIRTLAASGIGGFREILAVNESKAALKANVSAADVADACTMLLSPLARAVTGQVLYVDNGAVLCGASEDMLGKFSEQQPKA